jgi:hypothetical protein
LDFFAHHHKEPGAFQFQSLKANRSSWKIVVSG